MAPIAATKPFELDRSEANSDVTIVCKVMKGH